METTYVVYICDLCFRAIKEDSTITVWVIDEQKHDVCGECIMRMRARYEEDGDAG